jgi:hypothetical protein
MNRPFTALLAFLDALLVPVLGLGILLVPLTVVWAAQFELATSYLPFWRVAANFWLLGNGVDLFVVVDPDLAVRLALDNAGMPFEIGFAPLGIALLTLFLGYRAGTRLAGTPYRLLGAVVGVATVGVLGGIVGFAAQSVPARPSLTQAVVFPALVFAVGLASSLYSRGKREQHPEPRVIGVERLVQERIAALPGDVRPLIGIAFRGGAMAVAGILLASAVIVFFDVLGHYAEIISLYESVQAGLVGGIALTFGQLAIVPNVVVWAASWLVGPGFAIGTGSSISPVGTQVGLVPSLPLLGALPHGSVALGFAGLLVPIVAGFVAGVLLRPRLTDAIAGRPRAARLALTGLGIGLVGATIMCILASWSGGSAGPGRLADIGPNPGLVWLCAAAELTLGSILGLSVGLVRRAVKPAPEQSLVREANKL